MEEIRNRLESRKNDNHYSAGVIEGIGPRELTSLPLEIPQAEDKKQLAMAKFLGIHLAGASKTWTRDKQKSVAQAIKESMDEKTEYGRATVLNRMLGWHGRDGNGNSKLSYNRDFLVTLGNTLRSIDWQSISYFARMVDSPTKGSESAKFTMGPYIADTSFDPLYGVLDVMAGDAKAAGEFFAPKGRKSTYQDIEDIKKIIHRNDLGDNNWTNNLTTIGANMAKKFGWTNFSKADQTTKNYMDKSALTTSVIFNEIGEKNAKLSDFARNNVATVLKFYAPGVDSSMLTEGDDEGQTYSSYISKDFQFGGKEWGGKLGIQPAFSDYALSKLIGQASKTKQGLTGMQSQLKIIDARRYMIAMNEYKETGKTELLKAYLRARYHKDGFVTGALNKNALIEARNQDEATSKWINASMDTASTIGKNLPGASVFTRRFAEFLENKLAGKTEKTIVSTSDIEKFSKESAKLEALTLFIDSKAFTRKELKELEAGSGGVGLITKDGDMNKEQFQKILSPDKGERTEAQDRLETLYFNLAHSGSSLTDVFNGAEKGDISFDEGYKRAKGGVSGRDGIPGIDVSKKFGDN